MNLKQLQYFLKLAETEHYRKAAEALYITEPSLNRAIRDMEKELGIQLFQKRSCPMSNGRCRNSAAVST